MLAFTVAFFGVLLAIILLVVVRHREPAQVGAAAKPTFLEWCTLALGLMAVIAFAVSGWLTISGKFSEFGLNLISIAFAFPAVILGIGNLIRHDRHWPTWAGLIAGLIPAFFWIAFFVGNLLNIGG